MGMKVTEDIRCDNEGDGLQVQVIGECDQVWVREDDGKRSAEGDQSVQVVK